MSRFKLSASDDWQLVYEEQDIRGWDVRDANDNVLGTVDDMIVNDETEYVDTIVLEDGTQYPARDIYIGDGVVYVEEVTVAGISPILTVYDDYGQVSRGVYVDEEVYAGYGDSFRNHYNTTYGTTGSTYEKYEPAYRFGHELACAPRYKGRSYNELESDARTLYHNRYSDRNYDEDVEAIRYGYEHHRQSESVTT